MDQINTACLVREGSADNWGQVYTRNNFFISAEIIHPDAALMGKSFLVKISLQNFDKIQILADFKNWLGTVVSDFTGITYTAGLIFNKILYAKVTGKGQIFLKRRQKTGTILEGEGCISGKLQDGDIIFISNQAFADNMSQIDVVNALDAESPEQIAEILAPKLSSQNSVSQAALVVSFNSGKFRYPASSRVTFFRQAIKKFLHTGTHLLAKVRQNNLSFVIILLVFLLIISITGGIFEKQRRQNAAQSIQVLELARHEYDEAMALISLNPVRARELLNDAQKRLDNYEPGVNKKTNQEISELKKQIDKGLETASKKYPVSLSTFFEIGLAKAGGQGDRLSLSKNIMHVLDKKTGTVYAINVSSKSAKAVAGGDILKQARSLSSNKEEAYVLIDSVYKIGSTGSLTPAIKNEDIPGEAADISFYAGNIYLLDTTSKQIWKYTRTDAGFSGPQKYLQTDNSGFGGSGRLDINGSVWIADQGNIFRFTQGVSDLWQMKGLDEKLDNNLQIFISDETANLYILDTGTNRVLVTDKDGQYDSQYVWQEKAEITDFAVSESLKKIFLLARDKIYGIDIK